MRINSVERAKGSLAMFVSRGLVDPKVAPNWRQPNGKLVNIPAPCAFCFLRKLQDIEGTLACVSAVISRWRVVMTRSRRNSVDPPQGIFASPGAYEERRKVKRKSVPRTDTGAPG